MSRPKPPLLTDQELVELAPSITRDLPLDLVDANVRNPRESLAEVDQLADNIKRFGLLQPVTVRRAGDRYELLGGHRRRAAIELLRQREPLEPQWRTIAAVVRTADDEQADLMLISGQVHVRAWKPREEAQALERLLQAGLNVRQVGEALNRTESWASRRLRVYADSVLSGYVQSGALTTGVAEIFLSVKDPAARRDFAERAVQKGWSQQQAQAELRRVKLDGQLRDVAKRASELAEILSSIDPTKLPISATRDLWVIHGRIEVLARGGTPTLPTIEQAQRAAGINPNAPKRKQSRSSKVAPRLGQSSKPRT